MPVSVLIPPDNRLLGWTLSDLTLYGAPPTPAMTIGAPMENGGADGAAASAAPPIPPAAPTEGDIAAQETSALLDRADAQPASSHAAFVTPSPVEGGHGDAAPASPVPPPIGSSGTPLSPVATPLPVAGQDHAAPSVGGTPPADLAHAALGPTTVPTHAGEVVATPLATAETLAGDVAPATLASVDTLAGEVIPDPLTTADTLVDMTAPAALATVNAPVDAVHSTVANVDTLVGHIAGTVADPPMSAFGGSDPAAGVQTLIGMVESADAFDLGHAVTAHATDLTGSGSILDALAADAVAPPLLGDEHDSHAAHPLDDHGIHLGL